VEGERRFYTLFYFTHRRHTQRKKEREREKRKDRERERKRECVSLKRERERESVGGEKGWRSIKQKLFNRREISSTLS